MAVIKVGSLTCTIIRSSDHPHEDQRCEACGTADRISVKEVVSIKDNTVDHNVELDGFESYPWTPPAARLSFPDVCENVDEVKQKLTAHAKVLEEKLARVKDFLTALNNCDKFVSNCEAERASFKGE